MKNRILSLVLLTLIFLTSIGASANEYSKDLKEMKYTGWARGLYYEKGDLVKNNWVTFEGKTYYVRDDGSKVTGWLNLNNNWYLFDTSGVVVSGWYFDMGSRKYYYLSPVDYKMAHDTTINGYTVGTDGAWIK